MATTTTSTATRQRNGLGTSALRPDGIPKVQGRFAFSSDAWADNMLWGATLRSPHPHARIRSIDTSGALAINGVSAVITADDVPGKLTYGLIASDQPVFARDVVRYVGEPVAAVAADHPETARRALAAIKVDYEVLTPLVDAEAAIDGSFPAMHPDGNVIRRQRVVRGDQEFVGDVVVEGTYEIGMQDQAFLGLEAALALPDDDGGGIELFVATQWLHEDQKQIAACLDVPIERVRLTLGGVGGAFGGREDISLQVHCCLLALVTKRPIKMQYGREESFYG
ncbi:MAG: molybdopterin cofactor-binding domain-containing protein, partial [Actinomycetota bacterium]